MSAVDKAKNKVEDFGGQGKADQVTAGLKDAGEKIKDAGGKVKDALT
jgi:hypothetical protein